MNLDVTEVYKWTEDVYKEDKYRQIVQWGGTRSGKSYSILQFFIVLLLTENNIKITCWRSTKVVCRSTIMQDFKDILLNDFSIYSKFTLNKNEGRFTCKTNGSSILFEGCDNESKVHGLRQTHTFMNEITEIKEEVYDQITQRTSGKIFADFNPSIRFWFDKYRNNPNTIFFKSTYKNNPFLSKAIINKILSYDPNNPENVKSGTANSFMHEVYALGNQADKINRVLKNFSRCTTKFYKELDYKEYYGLDFGTANPTAIVGIKYDGDMTMFVRQLLYKPSSEMGRPLYDYMKKHLPMINGDDIIVCDSAKMKMVTDLQKGGFNAVPARKGPGSFDQGIATIQSFNIIVTVESYDLIEEIYGYEFKIDRYNLVTDDVIRVRDHAIDATKYCVTWLVNALGIQL